MHGRHIILLLALGGLGSTGLEGSSGYLRAIGPAALRFQTPPSVTRPPAFPDPAPEPAPEEPVEIAVIGPEPTPAEPSVVTVPPTDPPAVTGPDLATGIAEFIKDLKPNTQYAPPSALIRYFTGQPVSGVGSVTLPVGFTPPVAAPAVRSSATYEKGE